MADHYPAEWWSPRDHYTEEEVRHLEALYRPRPAPAPRPAPVPARTPAAPRPRPLVRPAGTCSWCGTLIPGTTRRERRYCSARCAHAARWARRRPAGPHPPCLTCGAAFPPYTALGVHYCSVRCQNRACQARLRSRRSRS